MQFLKVFPVQRYDNPLGIGREQQLLAVRRAPVANVVGMHGVMPVADQHFCYVRIQLFIQVYPGHLILLHPPQLPVNIFRKLLVVG